MKILIIEDDTDIANLLIYNFKEENWPCLHVTQGNLGIHEARNFVPDMILLDLMLPDMSGLDVCRSLKSNPKTKNIPIIILTAKGEEIDRIVGFEIGADDYVTKPFSPRELILRVKAIYKRTSTVIPETAQPIHDFGIIRLDTEKYKVTVDGKDVKLTSLEFKILKYLIKHRELVATRERLLDKVWGYNSDLTTRTVDTHMKRLREKLGKGGLYIETIRGVGYRLTKGTVEK